MRVLLVCLGNICRSPLAQGIVRHHAARLHKAIATDSAGTYGGHHGDAPDARARAVAKAHGISIDDLRARRIRPSDFANFDYILVADRSNYEDVCALAPADSRATIAYMLDPEGKSGAAPPVPDPYYGDKNDFEQVYQMLDRALGAWVERL